VRIITRTADAVEPQDWRTELAGAFRQLNDLLDFLDIPLTALPTCQQAQADFPLLVPRPYAQQMEKGNIDDPLLLQVLPQTAEMIEQPGYVVDPLAEKHSNIQQGIIHKYHGRVLLLAASGCAVNCRYCFRRHFPYQENRVSRHHWQQTLDYVANDSSIEEVILSGGDPLMLQDQHLDELITAIESIPHVRRLRIHSRLPVVIPQRITDALCQRLSNSRLHCSCVLHINHGNELSEQHYSAFRQLRQAGVTLLNQTVLLRKVNDSLMVLAELNKQLFEFGILPYYLHLLDPVKGAAHFDLDEHAAVALHQQLLEALPGYLVPRLVREESGKKSKTPIIK
jgi:EF-P beta-lysylation protein EpmB